MTPPLAHAFASEETEEVRNRLVTRHLAEEVRSRLMTRPLAHAFASEETEEVRNRLMTRHLAEEVRSRLMTRPLAHAWSRLMTPFQPLTTLTSEHVSAHPSKAW